MDQGAVVYNFKLFLQRILGLLFFLLGSWWSLGLRAVLYFTLYIVTAVICAVIMYRLNSQTLRERKKVNTDSPLWDKILLTVYWLSAYFFIYYAAGTQFKAGQQLDLIYWLGIMFYVAATVLTMSAMTANTFLESTARIQTDRDQKVCTKGPYAVIRHSAYSAILIWCLSVSFVFPSMSVFTISAIVAVVIVTRTYLEDEMLKKGLDGYLEYTQKTKYRLIPFLW